MSSVGALKTTRGRSGDDMIESIVADVRSAVESEGDGGGAPPADEIDARSSRHEFRRFDNQTVSCVRFRSRDVRGRRARSARAASPRRRFYLRASCRSR
jgi:hypothetical protein